jgi:formylglycine-generating enzyme required for sulfatase activity
VSQEEAAEACAAIGGGWRLCTRDEWHRACSRDGALAYPYGPTYDPTACNGADHREVPGPVATGAAARCVARPREGSADALFDLSGNVREWVSAGPGPAFELRGGAYNTASLDGDAPGLRCDAVLPAPAAPLRLPAVGFRCCHPGRLPP